MKNTKHVSKYAKDNILYVVITIFLSLTCGNIFAQTNPIVKKSGKELLVRFLNLTNIDSIEIHIHSNRNVNISKSADSSAYNPAGNVHRPSFSPVWYPVIDIFNEDSSKGVAVFSNSADNGKYSMNGMYFKQLGEVVDTVFIDKERLLNWENNLTTEPAAELKGFYLSYKFPISRDSFEHTFRLLSANWSGRIVGYGFRGNNKIIIGENYVKKNVEKTKPKNDLKSYHSTGLNKERLLASLKATVKFTMGMQDKSPNSPNFGGLNLFYDYDSNTYRRSHWIWASGPSIKLLLETAKNVPEITSDIPAKELRQVALEIGKAGQNFQDKDPNSPTYGIVTSRWKEIKRNLEQHAGFEKYYSIADALWLIGWGWMPLYHDTADKSFLEGSKLLVDVTKKLLDEYEIIPMDYIQSEQRWKDYTISEAGFGPEGIVEVYFETKDEIVKSTGVTYIERLLNRFQQENGLWARKFKFNPSEFTPSIKHTRGQGWAMEGLISSFRTTKDDKYKELATRMANVLMKYQNKEGYWSYLFDQPANKVGISEKGTALWSHLFYRLYDITKNPEHLKTARKALNWCLENQYSGSDIEGYGGIIGLTSQSGVTYRNWFPLACSYTSAFFGLAVLEELKLQNAE